MSSIASLTVVNQKVVNMLSRGIRVHLDKITGLVSETKSTFYALHPHTKELSWAYGLTTVNGETPTGPLYPVQDVDDLVDEVVGDRRYLVSIATRKANTRVGIHVHEYAGTTFVVGGGGQITDFVEGMPNGDFPVGSYYYMPANIPMAAANLSSRDVRLMDIFIVPAGAPPITILEPAWFSMLQSNAAA